MPARMVYQPVVTTDNGTRVALSSTLVDPGIPAVPSVDDDGNPILITSPYAGSFAVSNGAASEPVAVRNFCFGLVAGVDMSTLDDQTNVVTLFEAGTDQPLATVRDWLGSTPAGLAWNNSRVNRLRNRIENAGGNVTGLDTTTPLWRWCNAVGQVFTPGWDVRLAMTSLPGA